MDETLMTYLRNIISLEQARYVQGQLLQRLHAAAVPPRKAPSVCRRNQNRNGMWRMDPLQMAQNLAQCLAP